MPKKLYTLEPAVIFSQLIEEFHAIDSEFSVKTDDPDVPTFVDALITQHYPAQAELPLN